MHFHSCLLMWRVCVCICFMFQRLQRGERRQWSKSKRSVQMSSWVCWWSLTLHMFFFLIIYLRTRRTRSCWQSPQHPKLVGETKIKEISSWLFFFPELEIHWTELKNLEFHPFPGLESEEGCAGTESRVSDCVCCYWGSVDWFACVSERC